MKKIIKILILALFALSTNYSNFAEPTETKEELEQRLKEVRAQQKELEQERKAKKQEKKKKEEQKALINELADKLGIEEEENQKEFKKQIKDGKLYLNEGEYKITNEEFYKILVIMNEIQGIKKLDLSNQKNLLVPVKILKWGEREGNELIYDGTVTSLISDLANLFAYQKKSHAIKGLTKQLESKKLVLNDNLLGITDDNIDNIVEKILEINEVRPIETLVISNHENLTKIPKNIGKLTSLERLVLNKNKIKTIYLDVNELTNLKDVILNNNPNLVVPKKIIEWGEKEDNKLFINETKTQTEPVLELAKKLNITDENAIKKMKDNIIKRGLLNLNDKAHNISDNNIGEIFEIIIKINNLNPIKQLAIQNQENLTKIPESIGKLTALTLLAINHNQITEVPREIGDLKNLTMLFINNNQITEIPEDITNLEKLNILNLSNNPKLLISKKTLEWISKQKLESLSLEGTTTRPIIELAAVLKNSPTAIYEDIIQLIDQIEQGKLLLNKKEYVVDDSNIDTILEQIIKINKVKPIKMLVVSGQTNLTKIPKNIEDLTGLEILGFYNNRILEIPKEIGKLTSLEQLLLDNNQIEEIYFDIDKLKALKVLTLVNNPKLILPIIEIGNLNNELMFEAIKALFDE